MNPFQFLDPINESFSIPGSNMYLLPQSQTSRKAQGQPRKKSPLQCIEEGREITCKEVGPCPDRGQADP